MKVVRILTGALMAVGLLLFCFFGSFKVVVFNRRYINGEMDKLNIAERVSMTPENLAEVFDEVLNYLEGKRADLVISTRVDGVEREAFNDREKAHMVDVLKLFETGFSLWYAGIGCLVLALGAVLVCRGHRREMIRACAKSTLFVFAGFLLLAAVLAILMAVNFDRCFTVFHQLFFNNDLWLLDPRTDLMINMLPEQFFFDTAFTIGAAALGSCLLCLGASAVLVWRLSDKRKRN